MSLPSDLHYHTGLGKANPEKPPQPLNNIAPLLGWKYTKSSLPNCQPGCRVVHLQYHLANHPLLNNSYQGLHRLLSHRHEPQRKLDESQARDKLHQCHWCKSYLSGTSGFRPHFLHSSFAPTRRQPGAKQHYQRQLALLLGVALLEL